MSNTDKFTKVSYGNNNKGGRGRGRNNNRSGRGRGGERDGERNRFNGGGRGRGGERNRFNGGGRGRGGERNRYNRNGRGRGRNRSDRERTDNKPVEKKEIVPEEPKWIPKPSPQGTWAALVRAPPKKVEEAEENVDSE